MFSSRRGPFRFLLCVAVFVLVFAAVAELWLRTITPASEVPLSYQDAQSMIFRFDPTGPREGLYTVGRIARKGGHWRVNNAGWNSAVDYLPASERQRAMVALFGDSYIEALLTDVDENIDACLSELLSSSADVYAFGLSGWYLEQYVAVSRYAESLFQPDLLVIFIDSGDVVDSLRENGVVSPHLWQIATADGHFVEISPAAIYTQSARTRPARKSAILNYLRFNAKLSLPGMQNATTPESATGANEVENGAAGSDADNSSGAQWLGLIPAANYMVGRLCALHPDTPIVFVAHGDRYLSVEEVSVTPLFADALAVQAACDGRPQCHFLDLRPVFSRDWAANHHCFEAADGGHWNSYANRLVARTLAQYIEGKQLLDDL